MIQAILSAIGGLIFLVGLFWAAMTWLAKPQGQQAIRLVDALTPGDLSKILQNVNIAQKASQTRMEALSQSEALMAYFESIGSEEGKAAVRQLVQAVFSGKDTNPSWPKPS